VLFPKDSLGLLGRHALPPGHGERVTLVELRAGSLGNAGLCRRRERMRSQEVAGRLCRRCLSRWLLCAQQERLQGYDQVAASNLKLSKSMVGHLVVCIYGIKEGDVAIHPFLYLGVIPWLSRWMERVE
jgi:hypothetical protein